MARHIQDLTFPQSSTCDLGKADGDPRAPAQGRCRRGQPADADPYLRPVGHGVHTQGRRGVHRRAAPGWRALPAGCAQDRRAERGCCPQGPRLPVIPLDLVVHGLVGLVLALLSWVVRLLGLVEGGLGGRPGDVLLVYHRDGDVTPGELVTA